MERETNFPSAMKELQNLLEQETTKIEESKERSCFDSSNNYSYKCFPNYSIVDGDTIIADVYDFSDVIAEERVQKKNQAYNDALCSNIIPLYVFFYENGKWSGIHMFSSPVSAPRRNGFYLDPMKDYSINMDNLVWSTDMEKIAKKLNSLGKVLDIKSLCSLAKKDMYESIEKWFRDKQNTPFKERVLALVKHWQKENSEVFFRVMGNKMCLNKIEETKLFKAILGTSEKKEIYRFTSRKTLEYLLDGGKHAMSSIVCMNDKSEGFYADDSLLYGSDDENGSLGLCLNSDYFITSFSYNAPDDLTMWRLYGEDGKGIAITYSNLSNSEDYILAPVSYQKDDKSHPELDFVKFLFHDATFDDRRLVCTHWNLWRLFFKPHDYNIEREVRLLYSKYSEKSQIKYVYTNNIFSPLLCCSIKSDIKEEIPI